LGTDDTIISLVTEGPLPTDHMFCHKGHEKPNSRWCGQLRDDCSTWVPSRTI